MSIDVDKFYRVVAELDRLLVPGLGDGFWSARPLFAEMDSAFLSGWAACRLREIADDKEPLVFRDRGSLTINVTKGYAISLAMIDRPPAALFLYPQHYMARNVGKVPVTVRQYTPERPIDNHNFDSNARLALRAEFEVLPGACLERNGYEDVLDWESATTTGFVLRLHSESVGQYEWAFDRQTLTASGVTVLDSFSSQVTTAMQMLGALGAPLDRDFLEMGLASKDFHVRWETLKTISKVAPEMTLDALETLRNDPHPAIRRAAEKTIAMNAAGQSERS